MPARLQKLTWMLLDQLPTVLALAVLAGVGWWGFHVFHPAASSKANPSGHEENTKSDNTLPAIKLASEEALKTAGIETGKVEERLVPEYVTATGDLDFDQNRYAHLSTRASGMARKVYKNPGHEVKKGDVLALVASPEVAKLKFDLQQTLLTVHTRARYYQRLQESGQSTSRQSLDTAEASLREGRIRLSNDQQTLQNLGLTVSTEELSRLPDEAVAARLRTLGIPDTLLQELDESTLSSNLLPMYAPFDSMVIKRDIVPGELVTPGSPQFVLADVSRLWIMLHVRLEDVGKIREGQKVTFRLNGPDEEVPPAVVSWISAEADEKTRTVAVRADVSNPKGRLRPHTFGRGDVLIREEKRLVVPNSALQFDGTRYVVFACGDSPTEFQPLPVEIGPQPLRAKLGPRQEEYTVVLSGVATNQAIAVSGTHELLAEMQKERIEGDD